METKEKEAVKVGNFEFFEATCSQIERIKEKYSIGQIFDVMPDEIEALENEGELEWESGGELIDWYFRTWYAVYQRKNRTWWFVVDVRPELVVFVTHFRPHQSDLVGIFRDFLLRYLVEVRNLPEKFIAGTEKPAENRVALKGMLRKAKEEFPFGYFKLFETYLTAPGLIEKSLLNRIEAELVKYEGNILEMFEKAKEKIWDFGIYYMQQIFWD